MGRYFEYHSEVHGMGTSWESDGIMGKCAKAETLVDGWLMIQNTFDGAGAGVIGRMTYDMEYPQKEMRSGDPLLNHGF